MNIATTVKLIMFVSQYRTFVISSRDLLSAPSEQLLTTVKFTDMVESNTDLQIGSEGIPSPMAPDLIQLDSDGDVILSIESSDGSTHERLLVSSAVLSVASPVFSKMFRSGFRRLWRSRASAVRAYH